MPFFLQALKISVRYCLFSVSVKSRGFFAIITKKYASVMGFVKKEMAFFPPYK